MRKGVFGLREMMIAILATVILALIAIVLLRMINPASTSAQSFGKQASEVLNG